MKRAVVLLFMLAFLLAGQTSTSVAITSSVNPSAFGQMVTLSASITPSQATGKVTFCDGTTVLGVGNVSNGNAVLTTILPISGIRLLTARFAGVGSYASSISSAFSQTVNVNHADTLQAGASYAAGYTANIAVADFDGDGHLDLVTSNDVIFVGNGDGTFQAPSATASGPAPGPVATGDFNGDGRPDIVTLDNSGNVAVALSKG